MAAEPSLDDIAVLQRLVPAPEAIELLAAAYAKSDPEAPVKAHRDAAFHSLLKRLAEGMLKAWSTRSHLMCNGPASHRDPLNDPDNLRSYLHEEGSPRAIPPVFWQCLRASEAARKECDLFTGDFSFEDIRFAGCNCWGSAFDVYFDLLGLPREAIPADHQQLYARQHDKRPRLPDSKLQEWWKSLGPKGQVQTQGKLLELCETVFPNHHISRQRIRDLTGPRTVGRPVSRHKIDRELAAK